MIGHIVGGLRVTVATLVALGVAGDHAAAQSLVYASSQATGSFSPPGPVRLIEVPLTPTGPGGVTRTIELPGTLRASAVITFDGRYVAWLRSADASTAAFLEILDRRTGQMATPGIELVRPNRLRADAAALRLFVFSTAASGSGLIDSITVIEPSGARSFSIAPVSMLGPLSADGRRLFVLRRVTVNDQPTNQVFAIDPTTGAETRALPPLPANLFFSLAGFDISADERRLYVSNSSSVRVFDTANGTELANRSFSFTFPGQESLGSITLDERYNRLFVTHVRLSGSAGGSASAFVLDAGSLETLHEDTAGGSAIVVDPVQQITFARGGFVGRSGCGVTTVGTWGAAAVPISSFTVPLDGGCPSFTLAPAPRPPASLTAVVTGRRVTLQWPTSMSAHDYEIEAGSGTGLADLARLRTGGATTLTVDGVPPGTYYVRVRAVSDVGIGPASIERTIVVQ